MNLMDIATFAAFGGAVITITLIAVKMIAIRKQNIADVFQQVQAVYEEMNRIINYTNVDRCIVFCAHNGGRAPHVGSYMKLSVLYEVYNPNVLSIKNDYQGVRVDIRQNDILRQISNETAIRIKIENLPDSLLKRLYLQHSIVELYKVKIKSTRTQFFYLSAQAIRELEESDLVAIELAANQIRKIFKKIKS